jgi:hypothetical protein
VVPEEQTTPPPLLELEDEPEDDPLDPDADADDDEPEDEPDADEDPDADDADDEPLDDPADPESAPPDDDPPELESSLASSPPASKTLPARLSRPVVLTRSVQPAVPPSQQTTPTIPAYAAPRAGKTLLRTISR